MWIMRRADRLLTEHGHTSHHQPVFGPTAPCLYNVRMPNRAYASVWVRDFSEENMLTHLGKFLATVPVAAVPPPFTGLIIRAVNFAETPLEEFDLRGYVTTPEEIVAIAKGAERRRRLLRGSGAMGFVDTRQGNRQLEITARAHGNFLLRAGVRSGVYLPSPGHIMVDLGFEHLFTGHAGLLAASTDRIAEPQHPEEARFMMWMSQPQNLREYQEKTRENIKKLMGWMRTVEEALPVDRFRLWSEGEENFEARLDEILDLR